MDSLAIDENLSELAPPRRLHKENIFWISLLHIMALVAIPFFSWDALAVCLILLVLMSTIGINLTYHRMLSHRSFKVPKWLEYICASIGAACAQGPTMLWVAEHRLHHRFSDKQQDPHNSTKGFWYAHVGHLFFHKDFEDQQEQWMKYVPDLARQPYYRFLNKYWVLFSIAVVIPLYLLGGWSYVLWGGFVRIVLMLHITWFVNSASHLWGYRNYKTPDQSTNCWWVGILAAGEGWHNNHHAYPNSAFHGFHRWWELDYTYMMIRVLEFMGLATHIKRPQLSPPSS